MPEENTYSEAESRYFMWRWKWRRRIAIAQGEYAPELVLQGGRYLDVFTGELVEADIAIDAGIIAGIGAFPEGRVMIDARNLVIAPSFIDPHLHLESTMLWPPEIARAVVPRGTGAIVTDPHELANVGGLPAIEALRDACRGLPLDIRFTVPSCVPASPLESPGAEFPLRDIETMLAWPETVALGEMMNVPGILAADNGLAAELWAGRDLPRDGHAPGVTGARLQAYAGAGLGSDHESVTPDEARAKLRAGMTVMMRQGSSEKNLLDLLQLVTADTWPFLTFCSDDRDCHDLSTDGHMDAILRLAIGAGLDPLLAIRMATLNPARHWRLAGLGAVAPGYRANLVALADVDRVQVEHTFHNGRLVASAGELVTPLDPRPTPDVLRRTVNIAPLRKSQLRLDAREATRAIELIPGQIVTRFVDEIDVPIEDGAALASVPNNLLKIVSVERHHATGRVGVGLVRGFGLTRGAVAGTIAHDAHNIVAIGTNDEDILAAIATVAESSGGLAVVADRQVIEHLPLPLGGLMSDAPLEDVAAGYGRLEAAARALGSPLGSPFGQLAFLSLSVIPEARVTDRGFLDLRT